MNELVGGMKSFIGTISSYEGAEFPKQRVTEKKTKTMQQTQANDDDESISFDANRFVELMHRALAMGGREAEGMNLESDEDFSEEEEPEEFFSMSDEDQTAEEESAYVEKMKELMDQMDTELQQTKLAGDFEKVPTAGGEADEGEEEELRPVDVNLNLVKNILDSIEAQHGMAGPGSTLIKELRDLTKQ